MGKQDGLGFVSRDIEDLFRKLNGDFADKDPIELKPPYNVRKSTEEHSPFWPFGSLYIKVRLPGGNMQVDQIVRGEYMKWAIVESLAESISRIGKTKARPRQHIFAMMDQVEIIDVNMPVMSDYLWQFAEFRFDYRLRVENEFDGQKACQTVHYRMVEFEADFCKTLEFKFREIYHLTVIGLKNKQYILMEGAGISAQLELFEAAQQNDVTRMDDLLKTHTFLDVNYVAKPAWFPKAHLDEEQYFLYVTLARTPLLAAAEEGHTEAMRLLLDKKADVNYRDTSGFTAVYLAAGVEDDSEKLVNFLQAWDADISIANNSGYTPLHNACGNGQLGAVKELVEARADLNARSTSGAAPLHVAVINNQASVLELLIKDLKVNPDMPAFGGNTPVHEAVMHNSPDMIECLARLGSDINIESGPEHRFQTPLKMAMERKKKKAAKALQELGGQLVIEGHEYEEESADEPDAAPRVKGRLYQ